MAASAISSRRVAEITSFVGSAALVVFFALRGGGGYDLVARSEASVVIWVVLGAGIAVGVLPVGRWKGSGVWLLAALAALALWTALALSWTSSAERTTVELARVLFFLGVVALGLSLGDRRNRGALLGGLFLGAAVVVILALASRLFPASFPSDPVARFVGNARRLSYPFGYWNAVGCLGSMVLAAGACVSAGARPLWIRGATLAAASMAVPTIYLTYSRGAVIASLVALLAALAVTRARAVLVLHVMAVALGGAVVVLVIRGQPAIAEGTGSAGRGAVIGAAVAIACVCALVAVITGRLDLGRRLRMTRRSAMIVAAASAVILVAAAAVLGPGLVNRAWDSFSRTQLSVSSNDPAARLTTLSGERREVWASVLDAFSSEPVRGIGPGTFEFWWDQDRRYTHYARDAHSLYLETLGELGILGLLLVLAVVGTAITGTVVASRRRSVSASESAGIAAVCASVVAWATFAGYDWMWESTTVTGLALVGAGIALTRTRRRRRHVFPTAARVALPVACLVAVLVQLPPMSATSQVRGSEQAAARGDLARALARANDAVGFEPWASTPYLQRALVEELGGAYTAAARDAQRAGDRAPEDYRPWLILSRIEAQRGRVTAAIAAYRRALEAKPTLADNGS